MNEATKFTFDRVFDADGNVLRTPKPRPKTRFGSEEVEAIRREAYAEGLQAAQAKAAEAQAAALARIAQTASMLTDRLSAERQAVLHEALGIAIAAARRLAGGLLDREPAAEIEELFTRCLMEVRDAPRIVVHLPPALAESLAPAFENLAAEQGYDGQLAVKADADLGEADVRIEWGKGGAQRRQEDIDRAVEEAVANYLAADQAEEPDLFGFADRQTKPDAVRESGS